jgi:hypothetical protein
MRRLRFWFWLLAFAIAAAACGLDRGATDGETTPAPTLSGTAAPEATTSKQLLPSVKLPEVKLPEIDVPAGAVATAQAAVQQAGEVAGTAVKQAGEAAGTAVEQGGAAVATVRAINTPDFSQLTEKLNSARPDANGNLSVTLNESDLNHLLQLRYLVMSADPELRDATVRFEAGLIHLSGNVPLPLPVGVTLSLRPVVADGKFELEIADASLGPLEAPEVVLSFASNLVSSALSDAIRRLPEGFQLQSVIIGEGLLTISGRVSN